MNSFRLFSSIAFFLILSCCNQIGNQSDYSQLDSTSASTKKENQERLIEKYLKKGAMKFHIYSREWQEELDKGLAIDSTVAYLWQQKAMPMFKQGKYEVGMEWVDKAVKYNPQRWQDYRAFIKCIFAKTYKAAILDFEDYKNKYGYGYVMDHSYDFYIALSYLQLNEFEKAEEIFQKDYDYQLESHGKKWLHHLDLFYYGISKYEQRKYKQAIEIFDMSLEIYPEFAEVLMYKAFALEKLGFSFQAKKSYKDGIRNGKLGNTINEDNVIYERYPYQIRWDYE